MGNHHTFAEGICLFHLKSDDYIGEFTAHQCYDCGQLGIMYLIFDNNGNGIRFSKEELREKFKVAIQKSSIEE